MYLYISYEILDFVYITYEAWKNSKRLNKFAAKLVESNPTYKPYSMKTNLKVIRSSL